MITLGVVLGVLLGTTAGPLVGGLTLAAWLQLGQLALPVAKAGIIVCERTSCIRRSLPEDFSPYNHLGMGM